MKLSVEQYAELTKMAGYFNKIEEIAERMGVEVDALIEGFKHGNSAVYTNLRHNLLAISAKRQHVLRRNERCWVPEQASIVNLHVIVNEDHF